VIRAALGFLGLVPPVGWALLAGVAIATATGWHLVQVQQAKQEVRDEMSQQATRDALRRHEANQGVTDRAHKERLTLAAAAAAARAESHRLRDELAAARAAAAGPGSDGAATVPLELLGECSARRESVAREAAGLAAQVRGLQDWVQRVCLAPPRAD
jgi:hypothetical protein